MLDFEIELGKAVQYFWRVRGKQKHHQGGMTGKKDAGERSSVTGGKHADGFIHLVATIVKDAALPNVDIHVTEKRPRTLPGFYRPCKEWDLVVLSGPSLVAVVEVKSQVGSFGNNFNNRVEEALGNATDFWTATTNCASRISRYLYTLERPHSREWVTDLRSLKEIVIGDTGKTPNQEVSDGRPS